MIHHEAKWRFAAVIVGVIAIIAVVVAARTHSERQGLAAKARKFDEHCRFVRETVSRDLEQLSSADPALQQHAVRRFYGDASGDSITEIAMCTKRPPRYSFGETCWLTHDPSCRRAIAAEVLRLIPHDLP